MVLRDQLNTEGIRTALNKAMSENCQASPVKSSNCLTAYAKNIAYNFLDFHFVPVQMTVYRRVRSQPNLIKYRGTDLKAVCELICHSMTSPLDQTYSITK